MLALEIAAGVIIAVFALPWWRHVLVLGGSGAAVYGTIYASDFATPLDLVLVAIVAAVVGVAIWMHKASPQADTFTDVAE